MIKIFTPSGYYTLDLEDYGNDPIVTFETTKHIPCLRIVARDDDPSHVAVKAMTDIVGVPFQIIYNEVKG
jgi:hypothetical protein